MFLRLVLLLTGHVTRHMIQEEIIEHQPKMLRKANIWQKLKVKWSNIKVTKSQNWLATKKKNVTWNK